MNDATLKAFIIEYSKLYGLDPIDVGMLAGALMPDYFQNRPECLRFVLELKQNAPTVFQTVKFIMESKKNDISK